MHILINFKLFLTSFSPAFEKKIVYKKLGVKIFISKKFVSEHFQTEPDLVPKFSLLNFS